jgi:hypothetical protein
MKYEALVLSLLLILPVGLIAVPLGNSSQHVVPSLYVNPPDTRFYGPCLVSRTFSIDVILWNDPLSGVDVYAFDFDISWASISTISFVSAKFHSPWTSYFTIVNSNMTTPPTDWHLAVVATPPSIGLTAFNASVLMLTFHIDTDVCYPNNVIGGFVITGVKMSGDGSLAIPITDIEVDNGTYEQYSVQPNIELTSSDPAFNATTRTIKEACVSHTFDVEVDLTNVTNVYGFCFYLSYDPNHLETDPQHIAFKAAFPPPYEMVQANIPSAGVVYVDMIRPSEKPTVCGANVSAVDIVFHTIDTWDCACMIPTVNQTVINITCAVVIAKCPCYAEYDYAHGNNLLLYGGAITYLFKPSKYDLNLDCSVDVQDLLTLLPYYGKTTPAGGFGDIYPDAFHVVDIYDFTAVAKNFGPITDP